MAISISTGGSNQEIGRMVREAAQRNRGGAFAILEGGDNHRVLGENVLALIRGVTRRE